MGDIDVAQTEIVDGKMLQARGCPEKIEKKVRGVETLLRVVIVARGVEKIGAEATGAGGAAGTLPPLAGPAANAPAVFTVTAHGTDCLLRAPTDTSCHTRGFPTATCLLCSLGSALA